jgi:hypothetical protein
MQAYINYARVLIASCFTKIDYTQIQDSLGECNLKLSQCKKIFGVIEAIAVVLIIDHIKKIHAPPKKVTINEDMFFQALYLLHRKEAGEETIS